MKKHKDILIGVLFVVIIASTLVLFASKGARKDAGPTAELANPGSLAAAEESFDFGSISMAAGKVTHIFAVKNTGAKPVLIKKLYTSCMCTEATLLKKDPQTSSGEKRFGPFGMPGHGFSPSINETLTSGEEVRVEVLFDPAAHGPAGIGKIERIVYLENDSGRPLELKFSAVVTP